MQRAFEPWGAADAHFVRDLRTTGFDARVFEPWLAVALRSLGFTIGCEGADRNIAAEIPGWSSK